MPKGYWIVRVDITDPEAYKAYVAANAAAFFAHAASSTPVTSSVVSTSRPASLRILENWARKSASLEASTTEAPWVTASAA